MPRNRTPASRYIAYNIPGDAHTYTVRAAPSSRRWDDATGDWEPEDAWLERTKARGVPANASNVRILHEVKG